MYCARAFRIPGHARFIALLHGSTLCARVRSSDFLKQSLLKFPSVFALMNAGVRYNLKSRNKVLMSSFDLQQNQ